MNTLRGLVKVLAVVASCFALFAAATLLRAQSLVSATWNGSTANWTTAADWNCPSSGMHCVPNNSSSAIYDVFFTNGGAATLDNTSTLTSLSVFNLSMSSGNLGIESRETLSTTEGVGLGTFDFLGIGEEPSSSGGSTLNVGTDLVNNFGAVQVGSAGGTSGALSVGGYLRSNSDIEVYSDSTVSVKVSTINSGTIGLNQLGSSLTTGALDNSPTSESTPLINDLGSLSVSGAATNRGDIFVGYNSVSGVFDHGASFTAGSLSLTNEGFMSAELGSVAVSGLVTNEGNIGIIYSTFAAGSVTNASNANLIVGSSSTNCPPCLYGPSSLTASNFSNAGQVGITSGSGLTVKPGGTYTQTAGMTGISGTLIAPVVDITGGTLTGSDGKTAGDVINGATVSPGFFRPTTLTINGDYTQNADGTLLIDISSATDFSILDVSGKASLDGTAEFDFLSGYVPAPNTDFAFLEAGSVAGDFSSLDVVGIRCPSCTFNLNTLSLDTGSMSPSRNTVPEPGTLIMFASGLLGMCYVLQRTRRRVNA
jgi:PEP-CTERM motif